MAGKSDKSYSYDHQVQADGSVAFRCSDDSELWHFLELAPHHPILLHTIDYFISVECSVARGTFDPEKWSALVWMDWECVDLDAGHAAHGVMENAEIDGKLGFVIRLFDRDDRHSCDIRGRGVVFRTRNFESWRDKAKGKIASKAEAIGFTYANRKALGIEACEHPFLSPISEDGVARGLITQANGMPPASRYISGSGDHVNAVHIAETARQFAALESDNPQIRLLGGEISFDHYVEFGTPIELSLAVRNDHQLSINLTQAGRHCTSIFLRIA